MTWLIRSGAAASVCAVLLTWSPRASADEPKTNTSDDVELRAQAAFERGQRHYSLGEYADAVTSFRQAYELTNNPELLFNVAQAHRLAGNCAKAVEVYRHFLYLSTDIELRKQAKAHAEALRPACATPVARSSAPALAADASSPTTLRLGATGLILGGVGAIVGLGAGAMYLWTSARHDEWRAEDQMLKLATPGTPGIDERVRDNDALARSIERWDRATLAAGITAGALVATGTTLFFIGSRRPSQMTLRTLGSSVHLEARF
jgi:tetratricopeptide (TPR) repeat protein